MSEFKEIPVSRIYPSPFQMRSSMDPHALDQLAESLRREGQQRPVKVRPLPDGDYELVFGHRIVEAAKIVGKKFVQAIVEDLVDEDVMWAQYAENKYREDISDYDWANWLRTMIDEFGHTQTELAERTKLSQPLIANHLRMLQLDGIISREIISKMSEFQARNILSAPKEIITDVCMEIEQFYEENEDLPSASTIKDIIDWKSRDVDLEEIITVPMGTPEPLEPLPEESDLGVSESPGKEAPEPLTEAEVKDDTHAIQNFIADYFSRYKQPDEDFLAWDVARRFSITESKAKELIADFKARRKAQPIPRRSEVKPERPSTCRCPLCGRDGADKNLIIMRTEDPELAQLTLIEFITEALR